MSPMQVYCRCNRRSNVATETLFDDLLDICQDNRILAKFQFCKNFHMRFAVAAHKGKNCYKARFWRRGRAGAILLPWGY